jgi:CheY-like chemotaxis protein
LNIEFGSGRIPRSLLRGKRANTVDSKAFDALLKINPAVKVILSSGYSVDGEAQQIMNRGCNGFIHKPFLILELSKKIGEILGVSI